MGREAAAAIARWPALEDHPVRPVVAGVCDTDPERLAWFERIDTAARLTLDHHELLAAEEIVRERPGPAADIEHTMARLEVDPLKRRLVGGELLILAQGAEPLLVRDPRPCRPPGGRPTRPAAPGEAWSEPGNTRERTVYSLTDKGLKALREYARTPTRFTPLKSDPLLRLLIADLVGEAATRESMAALRDEVTDIRSRLDDAERTAKELPHREKYLLLVVGFLRGLLDLHLELVDKVDRAFEPATTTSGSGET